MKATEAEAPRASATPKWPASQPKPSAAAVEAAQREFRRVNAVGDIRTKRITPKDNEIKQISVIEGKKTFKSYFFANQFTQSQFQDRQGIEDVTTQVLDEHQIMQDELFLLGEGTSASTMLNNGLFWSNDANYTLEGSVAIAASGRLKDFHTKVVTTARKADQVAGRKIILFYGSDVLGLLDSLHENSDAPVVSGLEEVLGANFSLARVPSAATPAGANGWIVANLDQVKLHHTALPQLMAQGFNEEKMYYWSNFLQGSMMLEVLAQYGVIRQPSTLA